MEDPNAKVQEFKVVPDDVPVLYLDNLGTNCFMVIAGVGVFNFNAFDKEEVAKRLENAASMVRKYSP